MSVIFNVPPILVGAVQRILGIQYFGAKFYVGRYSSCMYTPRPPLPRWVLFGVGNCPPSKPFLVGVGDSVD